MLSNKTCHLTPAKKAFKSSLQPIEVREFSKVIYRMGLKHEQVKEIHNRVLYTKSSSCFDDVINLM